MKLSHCEPLCSSPSGENIDVRAEGIGRDCSYPVPSDFSFFEDCASYLSLPSIFCFSFGLAIVRLSSSSRGLR